MAGTPPTSGIWALPSGAECPSEIHGVLGLCPSLRGTGSLQNVRPWLTPAPRSRLMRAQGPSEGSVSFHKCPSPTYRCSDRVPSMWLLSVHVSRLPSVETQLRGGEFLPDPWLSGPAASPLYPTPDLRLEDTSSLLSQLPLVSHHHLLGPSSQLSLGTGSAWGGVWAGPWFP